MSSVCVCVHSFCLYPSIRASLFLVGVIAASLCHDTQQGFLSASILHYFTSPLAVFPPSRYPSSLQSCLTSPSRRGRLPPARRHATPGLIDAALSRLPLIIHPLY